MLIIKWNIICMLSPCCVVNIYLFREIAIIKYQIYVNFCIQMYYKRKSTIYLIEIHLSLVLLISCFFNSLFQHLSAGLYPRKWEKINQERHCCSPCISRLGAACLINTIPDCIGAARAGAICRLAVSPLEFSNFDINFHWY